GGDRGRGVVRGDDPQAAACRDAGARIDVGRDIGLDLPDHHGGGRRVENARAQRDGGGWCLFRARRPEAQVVAAADVSAVVDVDRGRPLAPDIPAIENAQRRLERLTDRGKDAEAADVGRYGRRAGVERDVLAGDGAVDVDRRGRNGLV